MRRNRMPPVETEDSWDPGPDPEDPSPCQFDEGKDYDPDLWEDEGE